MIGFSKVIKPTFFELNDIKNQIFIKENPIVPSKTTWSICGFLLDVEADSQEHKNCDNFIIECKHLFLSNIYSSTDPKEMDIDTTGKFHDIIYRLLELSPMFQRALNIRYMSDEFKNFMMEDLENVYTNLSELKEHIDHIAIPKKLFTKIRFVDKTIAFIYSTLVKFCKTNKIKGVPMSKNIIENLKGIMNNRTHVHHPHIIREVIGYTHSYCNQKVRENYPKITVVAHNHF